MTGLHLNFEFRRNSHNNMLFTEPPSLQYKVSVEKVSLWILYVV